MDMEQAVQDGRQHATRWHVEQDEYGVWHVQRYVFAETWARQERDTPLGPFSMERAHARARVLNRP